ncbi:MAG: hypothetical protein WD532_12510 [Acidimicrobiia bacterium]
MRWMLAITTIGLLGGAALAWMTDDAGLAGVLARVGAILACIWIAYPSLVRIERRTIWLLVLGCVVVLIRPRSALVVLPVIALFVRTTKVRAGRADT